MLKIVLQRKSYLSPAFIKLVMKGVFLRWLYICTSWLILLYYHKASKHKIIPLQHLVSVMLDKDTGYSDIICACMITLQKILLWNWLDTAAHYAHTWCPVEQCFFHAVGCLKGSSSARKEALSENIMSIPYSFTAYILPLPLFMMDLTCGFTPN